MFIEILKCIGKGILELLDVLFNGTNSIKKGKYDATFLKGNERYKLLNRSNTGVTINGTERIPLKTSLEHVLISGASGTGKTSCTVIPTILQGKHNYIVTDLDGTIFKKTSGFLKNKKNYKIQVFNLKDVLRSAFFNVIDFCEQDDSKLKMLAQQIVVTAYPNPSSDNLYWSYGAESIIYIFLRILKHQPKKYRNLTNLRYLLQRYAQLEDWVRANSSNEVWNDYLGFSSGDEKTIAGHLSSALVALDRLSDKEVSFITSKNTIDFEVFANGGKQKSILYIIVPEEKLEFHSFILSLFYQTLFQFIIRRKPISPLMVILDEFSNMGRIKNFATIATSIRRYNTSLTLIAQDYQMIVAKYGVHNASAIINGSCRSKLFFPGVSIDMAEKLSRSFGKTSIQLEKDAPLSDRNLLEPSEIIQIKEGKALFTFKNLPPLITNVVPYYEQYAFRKRSQILPLQLKENPMKPVPLIPLQNKQEANEEK
jgi:type IV secretory pathway TraG/TraD family ATPase VirD4